VHGRPTRLRLDAAGHRPARGRHIGAQEAWPGGPIEIPQSRSPNATKINPHDDHRRCHRTAQATETFQVVTQITQLVAADESLKLESAKLQALNEQPRSELLQIGSALGSLTGGGRRGRGGRGAATLALPDAKPRQKRRPITDPEILARRNAALAKARAARAEKLAAARAAGEAGS
jgi:hypothetical protein